MDLFNSFSIKADAKTRRYLIDNNRDGFLEQVKRLENTVNFLQLNHLNNVNTISKDGSYFNINEYAFPKNICEYIYSGKIFLSQDNYIVDKPVLYVETRNISVDDIMSPLEVKRFFDDFNSQQSSEGVINLITLDINSIRLLQDFNEFFIDDTVYTVNTNGNVPYFCTINTNYEGFLDLTGCCRSLSRVSKAEEDSWFLK